MHIATKAYGDMEINEKQIIDFPQGIIGFEELKKYALLDALQEPFYWLQSIDEPHIAFVLINPEVFRPGYTPGAAPEDMDAVAPESPGDLLIFAIVTVPENQDRMTANLQGPVLINRKTRTGRQIISLNPEWKLKHSIMDELAALKG